MSPLETIPTLREAGFFKSQSALTDAEILALAGKGSPVGIRRLVEWDAQKCIHLDLEAGVSADNQVYAKLLHTFAQASDGAFNPTNIEEFWGADDEPIEVRFTIGERKIVFEPEYLDQWIDADIFEVINAEMTAAGKAKFCACAGPKDAWFGQDVYFFRLTPEELQLLKEKLEWNFGEEQA